MLIAGTIAGQAGAGAAATAAAPAKVVSSQPVPAAAMAALQQQAAALVKQTQAEHAAKVNAAHPAKTPPKAVKKSDYNFADSSYILTIRSGGIEYFDDIPRRLNHQEGFSYVDLIHDIGQTQGRCESFGAAYWLGQEVEEGVLGKGAAPPDAGDVSGGYRNPTTARSVYPNLSAGKNESDRSPGLTNPFPPGDKVYEFPPAGPGYHWTAKCDDDTHGKAQGDQHNFGGFQIIGSTSQAEVDKTTGVYTGTSRAYFMGLEGAAGFDSGSSFMQIQNKPNTPATITYRMSYFNSGENANKNGISFGGSDVPVQQFADQFNDGAKTFSQAAAPVGPMGAMTLAPEVGVSTDGGRYSISIAAGSGHLGFAAREGTIGQNQGMRIGSITFEGVYGSAN